MKFLLKGLLIDSQVIPPIQVISQNCGEEEM